MFDLFKKFFMDHLWTPLFVLFAVGTAVTSVAGVLSVMYIIWHLVV